MSKEVAQQASQELLKAQKLAKFFDQAFTLPVVNIKLGLDFFLGLVPVLGDGLMLLLSLRIIHLGKKMGMPKALIFKMVRNALFDMLIGFIPLVGDIADVLFTANTKNVKIMEQWWLSENKSAVDAYTHKQLKEWESRQIN